MRMRQGDKTNKQKQKQKQKTTALDYEFTLKVNVNNGYITIFNLVSVLHAAVNGHLELTLLKGR